MPSDESGAWVPASELYSELRRLSELVTRLDERLANDKTPEEVTDLQTRMSALEQRVWRASGFAAAVGALVGVAVPFMTK
jgi:predicted nuclease with TOPRIM domain